MKTSKAESDLSPKDDVLAELQRQLSSLKVQKPPKVKNNVTKLNAQPLTKPKGSPPIVEERLSNRPKPCYCFQCGEDGHNVSSCSNGPNPALVAAKRKQLKERQTL